MVNNSPKPEEASQRLKHTIYVCFFLFHVISTAMVSQFEPFPAGLDELAHYSYIRHAADTRSVFINHDESFLLNESHLKQWSDTTNYLSHPTFYYLVPGIVFDITGENPEQEVARLRIANIFLSSAAIAILFICGSRMFGSPASHIVYAAVVSMLPKIAIVGGIINNDNLAFFGAACAFLGLSWLLEKKVSVGTALLIGTGFALAALAKLTAGLLVGLMIVFVHAGFYRELLPLSRKHIGYLAIMFTLALIGVSPYLYNIVTIGKPIYINYASYTVFNPDYRLSFDTWGFIRHFFSRLAVKWAAYEPSNIYQIISLYSCLALGSIGLIRTFLGKDVNQHFGIILKSAFLTILITLVVHINYLHSMYEKTGHYAGATIRYYIPIWPAVAMAAASGAELITNERVRSYMVMLLIALLFSSTAPFAIIWHHFKA